MIAQPAQPLNLMQAYLQNNSLLTMGTRFNDCNSNLINSNICIKAVLSAIR